MARQKKIPGDKYGINQANYFKCGGGCWSVLFVISGEQKLKKQTDKQEAWQQTEIDMIEGKK